LQERANGEPLEAFSRPPAEPRHCERSEATQKRRRRKRVFGQALGHGQNLPGHDDEESDEAILA